MKKLDIVGQRFGLWEVLTFSHMHNGHAHWNCKCDCGNVREVAGDKLRTGKSSSCGCKKNELISVAKTTHGLSRTKCYEVHTNMMQRCYNPEHKSYHRYGGRGITVCDRWHDIVKFHEDMGNPPSKLHTISRQDNNGNYEPSNVIWEIDQDRNKSTNAIFVFQCKELCMTECSELSGIPVTTIWARREQGWSDERIFSTPVNEQPKVRLIPYTHPNGDTGMVSMYEAAKLTGQSVTAIKTKLDDGCDIATVLSNKKRQKKTTKTYDFGD